VPIPSYTTTTERFLREDGTWTTPDIVTTTTNGLMSYLDKIKLDSTT
jgi:hypothetical protein